MTAFPCAGDELSPPVRSFGERVQSVLVLGERRVSVALNQAVARDSIGVGQMDSRGHLASNHARTDG